MLPSFARETIERVRPAKTTDRGDEVLSYGNDASVLAIPGCIVQPGSTAEANDDRSATLAALIIHAPADADIDEEDHIRWRGKEYEIFGEVNYQPSASQGLDHLYILANRWKG